MSVVVDLDGLSAHLRLEREKTVEKIKTALDAQPSSSDVSTGMDSERRVDSEG